MRIGFRAVPLKFMALAALLTFSGLAAGPEACAQARLVQTIEGFHSPAAVAVAEDGRTFYVTNAARGEYGMLAGEGALSRLRLNDQNQLEVVDRRFVEKLNAPLGIAVLPADVGPIPAGALAVAVGGSWTVNERGTSLDDDRERGAGVVFIHPESGEVLAHLYLGAGSTLAAKIGHPIRDPMAVAADAAGNLILTDVAGSGVRPLDPAEGVPGILKLTSKGVAALLAGEDLERRDFLFAPVRNLPTGVYYARHDKSLYWITGQIAYDLGGAVMRLPNADYTGQPETIDKELGALLGFTVTPKGTIIASRSNGDMLMIHGRKDRVIKFKGHANFAFLSPGQPAATLLPSGETLVVVPEMSGGHGPWRQRLRTFVLPAKY